MRSKCISPETKTRIGGCRVLEFQGGAAKREGAKKREGRWAEEGFGSRPSL